MRGENVFVDDRIPNSSDLTNLCEKLDEKTREDGSSSYVLKSALGLDEEYDYKDGIIVLIPKHFIVVVDLNNYTDKDSFDEFYDEVIEDLGYLSDRYEYKKVLGRPRVWRKLFTEIPISQLIDNFDSKVEEWRLQGQDERKVDLLISLLIGSINDPLKVGADVPETDLMKVKKNIILFDSTQSRFVYESSDSKVITIQGLAGTGKTELLLHKLQKLYLKEDNSRIAFTCFNRVLANDMENRVTSFFNFMHVDKQIEWNKRLWVFRSWGSGNSKNSGLYSYICNYYGIKFINYSQDSDFGNVCRIAINQIHDKATTDKCFDYLLIDESQDFSQPFFDLCDLVTKKQVIRAGDIFQNIFDASFDGSVDCEYLLNKCYRTDPRTLMFAHSIGMGLYERPVIRWLQDKEWQACGYTIERNGTNIIFSRLPIRRFQDISSDVNSVVLIPSETDKIIDNVVLTIKAIQSQYEDVTPDDIGIVLTTRRGSSYSIMDQIAVSIFDKLGIRTTLGHITKTRQEGRIFISNINNVKGLEFPFVICIQPFAITDNIFQRNAIYMALTRSFLTSYFIVTTEDNNAFIDIYSNAATKIVEDNMICVKEPSPDEIEAQAEKIRIETQRAKKSMADIIDDYISETDDPFLNEPNIRNRLEKLVTVTLEENDNRSESVIRGAIQAAITMLQNVNAGRP